MRKDGLAAQDDFNNQFVWGRQSDIGVCAKLASIYPFDLRQDFTSSRPKSDFWSARPIRHRAAPCRRGASQRGGATVGTAGPVGCGRRSIMSRNLSISAGVGSRPGVAGFGEIPVVVPELLAGFRGPR